MANTSIYRNLHRECWSLTQPGYPVSHAEAVLVEGPRFVVQPAGNAKVRRERKKNVHAFVRGPRENIKVLGHAPALMRMEEGHWDLWVSYNPYENTTFVVGGSDKLIHTARRALLMPGGRVWIQI